MALNVIQYEEIVALLRRVPVLVDELEARRSSFVDDVLAWLKQAEGAMEHNRLPVVSQIAAGRATLIEAGRGVQTRELAFVGRPTTRKIQEATAAMVLERSNDLLHGAIAERQAVFQEAERICRQVLAVAEAKGFIQACSDGRPHQAFLGCLQQHVAGDQDLASVYLHLVALVGKTDVLIFLDRALDKVA
jgi:hypothetical protein